MVPPMLRRAACVLILVLTVAAAAAAPVQAQQPTLMSAPPGGGITNGVAGTTDIEALVAAQTFVAETAWRFDIATQTWQRYTPGAPTFANNLILTPPMDIVILRRASET